MVSFHSFQVRFLDETLSPTAFTGYSLLFFALFCFYCALVNTLCGMKGAARRPLGQGLGAWFPSPEEGRLCALQGGQQAIQPRDRSIPTAIALPDTTWNTFLVVWECQDVYGNANIKRSQVLVQGSLR